MSGRLRIAALATVLALTIAGAAHARAAGSSVVTVKLPAQNVAFRDAPGVEVATKDCLTCHSAEYVTTQPAFSKTIWTAEVNKMKNVYGAPIPPEDFDVLVDYLVAQNPK